MIQSALCEHCNKSTLSLLLLRPSPVPNYEPLKPLLSDQIASEGAHVSGLLPARLPTESRFVLRMLRSGFVHVYIPNPPPPLRSWLVFKVTDFGDLIPESHPRFGEEATPEAEKAARCKNTDHNHVGMKILNIPKAHLIPGVWMAYSSNLWNEKLRSQNQANPKVMQYVDFTGCSRNTFKPTAEALKKHVSECIVPPSIAGSAEQSFRFNSLYGEEESLARNLQRAAACHPKTKDKELAVVLRDPVGVTVELNALRLRRHDLAKTAIQAETEIPDNAWRLKSSDQMLGLKETYFNTFYALALDTLAPVVTRHEFYGPQATNPFIGATLAPSRYSEREWEPLEWDESKRTRVTDDMLGRAWPKDRQLIFRAAESEAKEAWGKIATEYKETERSAWVTEFHERMKREHLVPVGKFEADWWAARQDAQFNTYFALHFDETDPNLPLLLHSSGFIYTREVVQATTPQPFTHGSVLRAYVAELSLDPNQASSVMLRALAANQKEIVAKLEPVLTEKIGTATYSDRNDKLHDIASELVKKIAAAGDSGGHASSGLERLMAKYSWLSPALGNACGGMTFAVACSMTASVEALATTFGAGFAGSPLGKKLMSRAQNISLFQRTTDMVAKSLSEGAAGLVVPMVISKRFPAGQALYLLMARGEHSRLQIGNFIRGGAIELTLLTDTAEMARYAGDIDTAVRTGAGRIETPAKPAPALSRRPANSGAIKLSDLDFEEAWRAAQTQIKSAKDAVGEAITGKHAVLGTLDGRLGVGTVVLNVFMCRSAWANIQDAKDDEFKRAINWCAMADAAAGVLGGIASILEVMLSTKIQQATGKEALGSSMTINSLRLTGTLMGVVGGIANGIMNWMKGNDAEQAEQIWAARFYRASSFAFYGVAATFFVRSAGIAAERMVIKGVAGQVITRIAARYGVGTVAAEALSGWGAVLLFAAVAFEVCVVVVTPTEMQQWARRTRFGNNEKKFNDWEEEKLELIKLLSPKPEAEPKPELKNVPYTAVPVYFPGL